MRGGLDFDLDARASPVAARTAGIFPQSVMTDEDFRHLVLENLRRDVLEKVENDHGAIDTIRHRSATGTTDDGLNHRHLGATGLQVGDRNEEDGSLTRIRRRQLHWHRLGQGSHGDVAHLVAGGIACPAGGAWLGVENRSLRDRHPQRPHQAGIVGNGRRLGAHPVHQAGDQHPVPVLVVGRDVEGRPHLGSCSREIKQHAIALDRQRDMDAYQAEAHHVGLDVVGIAVTAVGNMGDHPACLGLGIIESLVDRDVDHVAAVVADELPHPPFGCCQSGKTGLHVAPVALRGPAVGENHVQERLVDDTAAIEFLWRDPQAFLDDLVA